MTVQELIDALSKLDPSLPIWEAEPYGAGWREFNQKPRVDAIAIDPKGVGKPRVAKNVAYEGKPERWSERVEAVVW